MSEPSKSLSERATAGIERAAPIAVRAAGEAFVPGATLLLNGDIKRGSLHLVAGVIGRAMFGPLGWFLAGANSYSQSTYGKPLHKHFST